MSDYIEDLILNNFRLKDQIESMGPTIRTQNDGSKFTVEMPVSSAWIQNPLMTDNGTVGEMNRRYLHERLDNCIALHLEACK